MSRQNYYKQRKLRQHRQVDEGLVLSLVRRERAVQPKLGTRKLLHMLKGEMRSVGVYVGRDRFFGILGKNRLLIPRRRGCVAINAIPLLILSRYGTICNTK